MKVIITAAGAGSRFESLGLKVPKYLIKVKNQTIFYYAISSLSAFFDCEFIFIFLKNHFNQQAISNEISKLGIKKYQIVLIDQLTKGQAETVLLAKNYLSDFNESILIYNIDTYIASRSILKSSITSEMDGLIYTTKIDDNSTHWSFILPSDDKSNLISKVVEKKRISQFASIGLYYFKSFAIFENIIKQNASLIISENKELYIAPIYQYMIDDGYKVCYHNINQKDFIPLGTPDEVKVFDANFIKNNV